MTDNQDARALHALRPGVSAWGCLPRRNLNAIKRNRRHQKTLVPDGNEGHDARDAKPSDSPLPRGGLCPITSGRSPGSWFPRVFRTLIAASRPSPSSAELEWQSGRWLPTYSGGTAPASHRLPCYALAGTRSDQQIFRTAHLSLPTTNVKLRGRVATANMKPQPPRVACDSNDTQLRRGELGPSVSSVRPTITNSAAQSQISRSITPDATLRCEIRAPRASPKSRHRPST